MIAAIRFLSSNLRSTSIAAIACLIVAIGLGQAFFGMKIGSVMALYFIVWWTILFAFLPFSVRSQAEAGEIVPGSEPGAPALPLLREKVIWTSVASTLIFIGIASYLEFVDLYAPPI